MAEVTLIIHRFFDKKNTPAYYPVFYYYDPNFFKVKTHYKPEQLVYENLDALIANRFERNSSRGHYGLCGGGHEHWEIFKKAVKSHFRMKYLLRLQNYYSWGYLIFSYENPENIHPANIMDEKLYEIFEQVKQNNYDFPFINSYKTPEERKFDNIRWKSEWQIFEICKKYYKDTIHQWRAPFLKSDKGYLACDIYIPSLNTVIEYQGEQHFHPVPYFDHEDGSFERRQELDKLKKYLLEEHDINLIYVTYQDAISDQSILEKLKQKTVLKSETGEIIETIKDGKMNRVFSCCGTDFTQLTMWMTPKYCPECGAKIIKKKEERKK